MFQLKDGGDVFLVSQSWLHRIGRIDEDVITSIDLPDTGIFPATALSDDTGSKIKALHKSGEKLILQELDFATHSNPDQDKTDWAAVFTLWQQQLGYKLADDGTLVPQGMKASAK